MKLPFLCRHSAVILNVDVGVNFCISLSLSTISLTATDCTLPADSHVLIFLRNIGDSSNHTMRSKILLACCALTRSRLMYLGLATACLIALGVIS